MGNVNSVPVASQMKSLVQAMHGDMDGARETQLDFIRRSPVVSQLNSLGQAIIGDNKEALRIQHEFAEHNQGVPLLGHMISAGYAACGQMEKAQEAAVVASLPILVIIMQSILGPISRPLSISTIGIANQLNSELELD